jgi:hypothetical protein
LGKSDSYLLPSTEFLCGWAFVAFGVGNPVQTEFLQRDFRQCSRPMRPDYGTPSRADSRCSPAFLLCCHNLPLHHLGELGARLKLIHFFVDFAQRQPAKQSYPTSHILRPSRSKISIYSAIGIAHAVTAFSTVDDQKSERVA